METDSKSYQLFSLEEGGYTRADWCRVVNAASLIYEYAKKKGKKD